MPSGRRNTNLTDHSLFNRLIRQESKFRLPGKTPGLVTCRVTTEGRTVQAVACRAAECGFDFHPRLQRVCRRRHACPLVNLDYFLVAAIATLIRYVHAVSGPLGLANGSPAITLCSSFRSAQSSRRRPAQMFFHLDSRNDPGSGCVLP